VFYPALAHIKMLGIKTLNLMSKKFEQAQAMIL